MPPCGFGFAGPTWCRCTVTELIQELRGLNDVVFHHGADAPLLARFETESKLLLPREHKELLRSSNGLEACAGYVRLFGLHTTKGIDSVRWNQHDYWKFAWGDRCSAYWCFGETAWGDQFSYTVESLQAGENAVVFLIDAYSMTPQVLASCFAEFFRNVFVASAKGLQDASTILARKKFGPLNACDHVVYNPSILLGATEEIDNVRKMNARSAMICNGDIAMHLDARSAGGVIKSVEPYEDELHRTRLRLVWG
jgi:hypothetical protein